MASDNLLHKILFFPFLKQLSRFLLKRFPDSEDESFYISKVPVNDIELTLDALESEIKHFINFVVNYSLDSFKLGEKDNVSNIIHKNFYHKTISEKYEYIKQLHGEIHRFYLKVQNAATAKAETERLNQLIATIRNIMYAAKNIRDAQLDIDQISNSSNDIKYSFYTGSGEKLMNFYRRIKAMMEAGQGVNHYGELTALYQSVTKGYSETLQLLYKEGMANHVSEIEISTLINFNRQLYTFFSCDFSSSKIGVFVYYRIAH